MKVCVAGLWHLGCVTAACLAKMGHTVTGWDPDEAIVASLKDGKPPLLEPGLEELVREGLSKRSLSFSEQADHAIAGANVVWVAFDTPVDENDVADVGFVLKQVCSLMACASQGCLFLVSSQCPVGTVAELEKIAGCRYPEKNYHFACSPENLRLGKALSVFMKPDRIIAGVRTEKDQKLLAELLAPLSAEIVWMGVESAEMSKHAINAFLALSVTFANEIAEVCEQVGADAKEVERALKTEARIGPKAYLSPGAAFAGGTLARDVVFLGRRGSEHNLPLTLVNAIAGSNNRHKTWVDRVVERKLGSVGNGVVRAVWGLAYKPGTNTLRRSLAGELFRRLASISVVTLAISMLIFFVMPRLS
ncbi:MAG: nucleotide sugar dehydrogenase, partial [Kiritimatiellales bacterium]